MLADNMGYGDLSLDGNKKVKTPNLEIMECEGICLRSFFYVGPFCATTHFCLQTSSHYMHFGMINANVEH
jgi:arylsulfatase A-like enzyme